MKNRGVIARRGQITIFIIIGLFIVIAIGSGILIKNYYDNRGLTSGQAESLVPVQARPIKNFVDSCIDETVADAVRILGLQGGYINLPPDAFITAPGNQFSNALAIFEGLIVPYWYYEKVSGVQISNVPTLEQMNQEIANYVDANLQDCVVGLSVFGDQGYNIEVGQSETKVDIKEDEIVVVIDYPVDLDLRGTEFKLSRFEISVPIELGRYYNIATNIIEAENEHTFLENYTLDAMVVYEDIPFDSVDFKCAPNIWSTTEVEKEFKRAMSLNIPSIKIVGTEYDLSKSSREYFEQDILDESGRGLRVNFVYSKNWPFFMEVLEDENGVLKGESVNRPIEDSAAKLAATFFCMNAYHFVYDVKYPVLVVITDESALDGQGFTFQYALQVIIDNNQPRKNVILQEEIIEDEISICEKKSIENTVFASAFNIAGDLVPIEDADVEYKCLTTICPLGKTQRDELGQASLTTLFPPCVGGQAIVKKEGFFQGTVDLDSNNGESVSVLLKPYFNKKFKVQILDPRQGIRDPFDTEQIVFSLESGDYSASFVYPSDLEQIRLIPGEYTITSTIIRDSDRGITLQGSSSTRCFEVPKQGLGGLFGQTTEECVPINIESIEVNQLIVGGTNFDWTFDIIELSQDNELVFYTYYNGFPSTVEGMRNIYDQIDGNDERSGFRYPEFE